MLRWLVGQRESSPKIWPIGPYAVIRRLVRERDVSSMHHRISPDPEPGNIHKKRTGKLPVFRPLRCLRTLS